MSKIKWFHSTSSQLGWWNNDTASTNHTNFALILLKGRDLVSIRISQHISILYPESTRKMAWWVLQIVLSMVFGIIGRKSRMGNNRVNKEIVSWSLADKNKAGLLWRTRVEALFQLPLAALFIWLHCDVHNRTRGSVLSEDWEVWLWCLKLYFVGCDRCNNNVTIQRFISILWEHDINWSFFV